MDGSGTDERDGTAPRGSSPAVEEESGLHRRGWVLVGALVVAFLVVPATIVLLPPAALPFRVAYLVLPLIPAMGLGALAVWAALGARQ